MDTKNQHSGEHTTFPAHKLMEKSYLKTYGSTPVLRRGLKKTHTRRSRRYLKKNLTSEE
jgi:hypothetical protein